MNCARSASTSARRRSSTAQGDGLFVARQPQEARRGLACAARRQFRHITELRERCAADNVPVISVDTKKKELVGTFRNPGAKWTPHHFASCIFASSSVRGRLLRSIDPGM